MSRRRNDEGSIALTMLVMLVATGLVVATLAAVENGLRSSRRAGDTANALQVADAGINDAVQAVHTVVGTSFTRSGRLGSNDTSPCLWLTGSKESIPCYSYTATKDAGQRPVWHIDAVGVDATGVKRHVRADAVATSLFNTPLFVNSTLTLSSGISLDSFSSGESKPAMCTKKGIIGTNAPSSMSFGSNGQGQGVNNCQKNLLGLSWDYSMDGCTSYGASGTQSLPPTGTGKCPPPPDTFKTLYDFQSPSVKAPLTACTASGADPQSCWDQGGPSAGKLACPIGTGNNGAAAPNETVVNRLEGGTTYYPVGITLLDGCTIHNPVQVASGSPRPVDLEHPVVLYTAGRVDIGNSNGQGGIVNPPPASTSICGNSATSTLTDSAANPGLYYCPLWSGGLRIRVIDGTNNGPINIRSSGTKFWGAMEIPQGAITLNGSQITVWGSVVSNTGSSNAQYTWHFDDELTQITTDQFSVANWREEPVG